MYFTVSYLGSDPCTRDFLMIVGFYNVRIHRDNIIHSYPSSDFFNSAQNIFPETYILSNLITFIIKENWIPH